MDTSISKKITFYFKKVDLINDDGLIFSNDEKSHSFLFGNFEVDYYAADNSGWIGSVLFYSSPEIYVVSRRYQKFQEAVANLGGLANALLLLGYFFTYFEKEYVYFINVFNKIHCKSEENVENSSKDLGKIYPNSKSNQTESIEKTGKQMNKESEKLKFFEVSTKGGNNVIKHKQSKKKIKWKFWQKLKRFFFEKTSYLKHAISVTLDYEEKLNMNFIDFLKFYFKPNFMKLTTKEKLIKTALEIYKKKVDILNVIGKLEDIDKIKHLLVKQQFPSTKSIKKINFKVSDEINKPL